MATSTVACNGGVHGPLDDTPQLAVCKSMLQHMLFALLQLAVPFVTCFLKALQRCPMQHVFRSLASNLVHPKVLLLAGASWKIGSLPQWISNFQSLGKGAPVHVFLSLDCAS